MKHRGFFLISILQFTLGSTALAQQAPFDTVIRGGRFLDGTGAPLTITSSWPPTILMPTLQRSFLSAPQPFNTRCVSAS